MDRSRVGRLREILRTVPHAKVVDLQWVNDCIQKKCKLDEKPYVLGRKDIPKQPRKRKRIIT